MKNYTYKQKKLFIAALERLPSFVGEPDSFRAIKMELECLAHDTWVDIVDDYPKSNDLLAYFMENVKEGDYEVKNEGVAGQLFNEVDVEQFFQEHKIKP